MIVGKIEPTDEEPALAESIEWLRPRPSWRMDEISTANAPRVAELFQRLSRRVAISEVRVRYFTGPDYTGPGRSSHERVFERNGTARRAIIEHLHFLPFFWYFIHGADLPNWVKSSFAKRAGSYLRIDDLQDHAGALYGRRHSFAVVPRIRCANSPGGGAAPTAKQQNWGLFLLQGKFRGELANGGR